MTEIRSALRMAAAASVLGLVLAGCGEDDKPGKPDPSSSGSASATDRPKESPTPDSGKAPWGEGGTPAASGKKIGASGSPCADLPVTFTSARGWTSEAVKPDDDFEEGGLMPLCEVDAKPAGNIGYLRIFTGDTDASPREALAAFVKGQSPQSVKYRTPQLGGGAAAEVSFVDRVVVDGEEIDSKPSLAFAVPAGDGVAVVSLGAMDAQEHTEMLPAYLLARDTVKVKPD